MDSPRHPLYLDLCLIDHWQHLLKLLIMILAKQISLLFSTLNSLCVLTLRQLAQVEKSLALAVIQPKTSEF